MTMKRNWLIVMAGIVFGATAIASSLSKADTLSEVAGNYVVQPFSKIGFHVDQVAGNGISGEFTRFEGTFKLNRSNISSSSIEFTLYPESVSTGQSLVESFLRSNAVFDAGSYPKIVFKSTEVIQNGPETADIVGILTARGLSKPVTFQASLKGRDKNSIAFEVDGKILRSVFGMDIGVPLYSNVVQFRMEISGRRG